MPPRDIRALLHDIIEACRAVGELVQRSTFEQFQSDRHLRSSIEREFITIGEAVRCAIDLDETLDDAIIDAPKIIGFRNNLVHRYDKIDHAVVWQIALRSAPVLQSQAEALLAQYGGASTP